MKFQPKTFKDTYLYYKGNYEQELFKFIMSADRINKSDESFQDIIYDVKRRQVTPSLVSILKSNNVILLSSDVNPMPRAFKVFASRDVKTDKATKVFIDVSGIISNKDGRYTCNTNRIDVLIAYLLSAMNTFIYSCAPERIVNRTRLVMSCASCFASMVYYIIDYLRVGAVDNVKGKVMYLASYYFQVGLMGKDDDGQSVLNTCKRISGLSEREINMVDILLESSENPYKNIDTFIRALSKVIRADNLTLDPFIDKWMKLFGVGTQFGTELYTSFSTMITDAYVGAYLNNQKTIEKICGRNMVEFVQEIFEVGKGAV